MQHFKYISVTVMVLRCSEAGVFEPSHLGGLLQVLDVEQGVVDPEDDPVKQSTVQGLGHGVSHRARLLIETQTA